nr:SEC-C domain-containing protein [Atopobiaceae bacterium]
DDEGSEGRMFRLLGISSEAINKGDRIECRREAYRADVTYGEYTAFIFDYLRDNLVIKPENRIQRGRGIAIVDDVDHVLIDCGRTPCVITAEGSPDGISSCAVCDYYRMYDLLAGISDTASDASEELRGIYRLPLYTVGCDQNLIKRVEDEVFITDEGRWRAIARKARDAGCPVVIEVPRSSYEDAKYQLFKALVYWGIDRDLDPVFIDGKDPARDAERLSGSWDKLTVIVDDIPLYRRKWSKPSQLCAISTVRHNDVRLDHRFENYIASYAILDGGDGIEFTYMLSLDDPFMQAIGDVERIRKMGKAFGMSADQPIEGDILTKALGNIQSKTDNAQRLGLKRWIQLESPINWQQLNMFEQRNKIVDSIDVRANALGMVDRFAESLVDEACPADAPRSSWNLAKLNTELVMLESDVPLPSTRNAQTREAMLEMVRAWMEDALESKIQSLGLSGSYADEVLGRVMLRCIDGDWLKYRKKAQEMMNAVTWPKLSDDAAWRRTVEQFKEQLGEEYSEFQTNLDKSFLSTIFGVRKQGEKRSPTTSDPFRGVRPNDLCPCGSGKKFKACHGRPKENA